MRRGVPFAFALLLAGTAPLAAQTPAPDATPAEPEPPSEVVTEPAPPAAPRTMVKVLAMPDVKDAIFKQGSKAVSSKSPEDFARYIKAEMDKFHPVIAAAGLEGSQ